MKIRNILSLITLFFIFTTSFSQTEYPKHEFRAAWIQVVNGQFKGLPTKSIQASLIAQLNSLQKAHFNAIIFQVRPEADALYNSKIEPWSRYLTGVQGQAPDPYWDPMQFMIDECHKRGMEFHAWINPYRTKTNINNQLATSHIYNNHPEWFITYGDKLFFDPALPESRNFIVSVITDIVSRYDIDGIHMDDYFYPYPSQGEQFNDDKSFARYGGGFKNRSDWRRSNVDLLIRKIHETIRAVKPWVKFGVSPFGIYRNQTSDPLGSNTSGLQNYDDLYADVLMWAQKGWIDYNIPQIYWEIGHPKADYDTLVRWWAKNNGNRPLFIGQSVTNTISHTDPQNPAINQLYRKMKLERSFQTIQGCCQWPASEVVNNNGNYRDSLVNHYFKYPSLIPAFDFIDNTPPKKVSKVKAIWNPDGYILFWTEPKAKTEMDKAKLYVIYRFEKGENIDTSNAAHIVAITPQNFYKLPYNNGQTKYTYCISALDRISNESKIAKKKLKL